MSGGRVWEKKCAAEVFCRAECSMQVLCAVFAGPEMKYRPWATRRGRHAWEQDACVRRVFGCEMMESSL